MKTISSLSFILLMHVYNSFKHIKNKMNPKIIFFSALIIIAGAFISMKTIFSDEVGPHGGRLQKAGKYNIEAKQMFSRFYAYLLDSEKKAIDSKGLSCEIRFFLTDGGQVDLQLKPYVGDGFSLDDFQSEYTSYKVTFKVAGKAVSAKFENENILVKGK